MKFVSVSHNLIEKNFIPFGGGEKYPPNSNKYKVLFYRLPERFFRHFLKNKRYLSTSVIIRK